MSVIDHDTNYFISKLHTLSKCLKRHDYIIYIITIAEVQSETYYHNKFTSWVSKTVNI